MYTFMTTIGHEKVKEKLTGNVIFFLIHLLFEVGQQCCTLLTNSEGDGVEIIA